MIPQKQSAMNTLTNITPGRISLIPSVFSRRVKAACWALSTLNYFSPPLPFRVFAVSFRQSPHSGLYPDSTPSPVLVLGYESGVTGTIVFSCFVFVVNSVALVDIDLVAGCIYEVEDEPSLDCGIQHALALAYDPIGSLVLTFHSRTLRIPA